MHHATPAPVQRPSLRTRLAAVVSTVALVLTTLIGAFVLPIQPVAQAAVEAPGNARIDFSSVSGRIGAATVNNSPTATSPNYSVADNLRYGTIQGNSPYTPTDSNEYSSSSASQWLTAQTASKDYWSYISRGIPSGGSVSPYIQVANTSALGFKPNNPGSVGANQNFLVGTVRHNNFPISTNYLYIHSSIDVNINGVADSFGFDQQETGNATQDTMVVVGGSGNWDYYSQRCNEGWWNGTYYVNAYLEDGSIGCFSSNPGAGAYNFYSNNRYPYVTGTTNQTPGSDDILTVSKTMSTKLVIAKDGIPYRLVLWGFVPDDDGTCPSTPPSGSKQVNTFTTKEGQVSYGCLYGSFNQERYVRIGKTATADANSQGVTIPSFTYSTDAQAGAESVAGGTPQTSIVKNVSQFISDSSFSSSPLKPTAIGAGGTVYSSEYYAFLVGRSDFTISEATPSPSSNGGTQSGWDLKDLKCLNGAGDEVALTRTANGVSFDNVGVAPSAAAVPITCTYTNHYSAKSTLTLVKQLTNAPAGVSASQWPLTASGTDSVTTGTVLSDKSGAAAVTNQTVPSGTYNLSEVLNPTGVAGFVRKSLTCQDTTSGKALTVTAGDAVTLPDGHAVTCTFNNEYKTSSIQLAKTLNDPDSGYAGNLLTDTFPLQYSCGTWNGTTYAGTVNAVAGGAAQTVSNLPIGVSCTVSEAQPTGRLKDSSYHWLAPTTSAAVTTATGTTPTLRVTNTIQRDTGTLQLAKTVSPESGVPVAYTGATTRTFDIAYTCTLDGKTVASGTSKVANGAVNSVTVPAGAACTTSEVLPTTQGGDFNAGYFTWSSNSVDRPTVTVAKGATEKVTVTNRYKVDTVPLTVAKKVVGPDGTVQNPGETGYTGGAATFEVTVTCPATGTQTLSIPNDGSGVVQVPKGASCSVNEANTDANFDEARLSADFDWNRTATTYEGTASGVISVTSKAGATATVVNRTQRSYGGIAIAKALSPNDPSGLASTATFTFDVACYAPGVDPRNPGGATATYTSTAKIGLNEVWKSPTDTIVSGSGCLVTEEALAGTSKGFVNASYKWTGNTWVVAYGNDANGQSGSDSAVVTARARLSEGKYPYPQVTFTNAFERQTAQLHIKKMLALPEGATIDEHTYSGSFTCDLGGQKITGTWSQTRAGDTSDAGLATVTVADDGQGLGQAGKVSDTVTVYAGTSCQVTENALTGAPSASDGHLVWGSSSNTYGTVTFTPDANGKLELDKTETVTNQVQRTEANILISKTVTGGTAGVQYAADQKFTFAYTCWKDSTKATQVAKGSRSIVADSTEDLTGFTLEPGSYCEIYEDLDAQDGLKDPWTWDSLALDANGTPLTSVGTGTAADGATYPLYAVTVPEAGQKVTAHATNHLSPKLVSLRVSKALDGETQGYSGTKDDGSAQTFSVQVTCTSDDPSVAGFSGPLTISYPKNGSPETAYAETTLVPVGQHCTVTENPPSGGLVDASYAWGASTVTAVTGQDGGKTDTVVAAAGTTSELRVTNTIKRVYGTIDLTKAVTGSTQDGSALQGRSATYSGTFVCTHAGDPDVTGEWTVTGPGSATVTVNGTDVSKDNSVLPLGASCTPTETKVDGAPAPDDPRYHWGKVKADAQTAPAVVEAGQTKEMTVTNEVIRPVTSTTIAKVMKDNDLTGLNDAGKVQEFPITATCAPTAEMVNVSQVTVSIPINGERVQDVPRGWYCQITEPVPDASLLKDASYAWADPTYQVFDTTNGGSTEIKAEAGSANLFKIPDTTVTLRAVVTNSVKRVTGTLSLTKAYGASAASAGMVKDGTVFTGTYACTYDGKTVSQGTWSREGTGSAAFTTTSGAEHDAIPLTSSCSVTEDAPKDSSLKDVSWSWTDPVISNESVTVSSATTPAQVTVTNDVERVYSAVTVQKDYKGDLAALDPGATVKVNLSCTTPEGTTVSGSYDLAAAGVRNTADGSAEQKITPTSDLKVPAGSSCSIVEEALNHDPTTGQLSDSSWDWGKEAYGTSTDGQTFTEVSGDWKVSTAKDQTLTLRVTNDTVRQWGYMVVNKAVPDSTTTSTNLYTGTWTCTYTPVTGDPVVQTGTWSRSGAGVATITSDKDYDGDGVENGRVLVGSACTVAETSRPDRPAANDVSYQWTVGMSEVPVEATANAVDARTSKVVSPTSNAALTLTNDAERHLGTFKIAKAKIANASDGAKNGDDVLYYVNWTCQAGSDAPVSGLVAVTAGGEAKTVGADANGKATIPLGASCRVAEVAPTAQGDFTPGVTAPINLMDPESFAWNKKIQYWVDGALKESPDNTYAFTLPGTETKIDVVNTLDPIAQVKKTFTGTTQHLDANGVWDGTWDVAYSIVVTNPSSEAELRYALKDTPSTPAGSTLSSMRVTGPNGALDLTGQTVASGSPVTLVEDVVLPDGVTRQPDGTYKDANGNTVTVADPRAILAKGTRDAAGVLTPTTHTYSVVLNVAARQDGAGVPKPDAGTCAALTPGGDVTAVHNQADVTSSEVTKTSEDCGDIPASPTFSVKKENAGGATNAVRNADGSYTSSYLVTVTNTSTTTSKIVKDVTDALTLPDSATLVGATVSDSGAAAAALSGATPWTLAKAGSGSELAGGATRTFVVTVTFTVDSTSALFKDEEYTCGTTRGDGSTPNGIYNLASMDGDSDGADNNHACQELKPNLNVAKTLGEGDNGGVSGAATFDVTYTITASNAGALAQNTGLLTDVPGFATGLTINSVRVARTKAELETAQAVAADANGAYTLTDGVVVEPGAEQVFYIRFNVTLSTKVTGFKTEALACKAGEDGTYTSGNGLFNAVSVKDAAKDSVKTDNTACGPVGPRSIVVKKIGTQANADGSYDLTGAQFALYDVDPSTSGAKALEDGITVDPGNGALFTSSTLELGRTYWLVETKAPTGHNLMPRPVSFRLGKAADAAGSTTITLLDGAAVLGAAVTSTNATVGDGGVSIPATITVKDTETGKLPHTGGPGVGLNAIWAALLLAGALALTALNKTSRRKAPARA